MHKFGLMLLAASFVVCGLARPAAAIPQFQKEFEELYVSEPGEGSDAPLAMLFKEKKKSMRCLCCHQGKKSKKNRNAYGMKLSELLDKKKDKKNKEKIIAALKEVEALPSDPEDKDSPTFGDLIEEGKLPGGTLEDLQKEPEKPADEDPA